MERLYVDWTKFLDTDMRVEHDNEVGDHYWIEVEKVAGLQYYGYHKDDGMDGTVAPRAGDRLTLVREPDNQADGNAVRVEWRNGVMLGHLPRRTAKRLAPHLDAGTGLRAYVIHPGNGTPWSMRAALFGPALDRAAEHDAAKKVQDRLQWEAWAKVQNPWALKAYKQRYYRFRNRYKESGNAFVTPQWFWEMEESR